MSALPMPARGCTRCLCYQGMQRWLNPHHVPPRLHEVTVDDEGICNVCRAYQAEHDDTLLDLALVAVRERARSGVVVALSGGKDSVAALWRARHDLIPDAERTAGAGVVACLYDNGFIPASVVERARDLCARVDVELAALPADRSFASLVDATGADSPSPCAACAINVQARLLALCDARGIGVIVTGTNYWARWTDGGGPSPVTTWTTPAGKRVLVAHLPYLLRQTRAETLATVKRAAVDVVMMPGVSSNCRVPAIVQDRVAGTLGHVPELEDLSLEVIVGHITRAEALAELEEKAPAHRDLLEISSGARGAR